MNRLFFFLEEERMAAMASWSVSFVILLKKTKKKQVNTLEKIEKDFLIREQKIEKRSKMNKSQVKYQNHLYYPSLG